MGKRRQAQLRRVVHERLVHHQPAAPLGQPGMPFQQTRRRDAQAGWIVRIDHHKHIEVVDEKIDFLLHHFAHDVAVAAPGLSMFSVTG
ncbi:hypothetical protein D3C73_1240460 [compost metagenome]